MSANNENKPARTERRGLARAVIGRARRAWLYLTDPEGLATEIATQETTAVAVHAEVLRRRRRGLMADYQALPDVSAELQAAMYRQWREDLYRQVSRELWQARFDHHLARLRRRVATPEAHSA